MKKWLAEAQAHAKEGASEFRFYASDEARREIPRFVYTSRFNLLERIGGALIATYIGPHDDGSPIVRMNVPRHGSVGLHRRIMDLTRRAGGVPVILPERIQAIATLNLRDVEVIDSRPRRTFAYSLRAEEQLLKGTVKVIRYVPDPSRWYREVRKDFTRTAYFLAGYDSNEPGLSYFFCELPPDEAPRSVDEAYESLKPASVKIAEVERRKVLRQGDMFFIQTKNFTAPHSSDIQRYALHNSNHYASGIIRDGVTYVTGTVEHSPLNRVPDHRPLDLGTDWWLCVRNTVPVAE